MGRGLPVGIETVPFPSREEVGEVGVGVFVDILRKIVPNAPCPVLWRGLSTERSVIRWMDAVGTVGSR
ncbi:MAG: hypothetical protein AAF639_21920 [Chloroflexota bacterium]